MRILILNLWFDRRKQVIIHKHLRYRQAYQLGRQAVFICFDTIHSSECAHTFCFTNIPPHSDYHRFIPSARNVCFNKILFHRAQLDYRRAVTLREFNRHVTVVRSPTDSEITIIPLDEQTRFWRAFEHVNMILFAHIGYIMYTHTRARVVSGRANMSRLLLTWQMFYGSITKHDIYNEITIIIVNFGIIIVVVGMTTGRGVCW